MRRGDTLVVARIDRLARSLSHLLQVVEALRAKGAHFRSLADPIDTSGPSGVLVLQMLGAVAEFERSLIRERTRAGLRAAKARGRVGGNPGLRAGDPTVLRKLAAARRASRLAGLLPELDRWLPLVRKLRPARPWPDVADAVNAALPAGHRRFTTDRLVSAIKLLVAETLAEPALLGTAPRRRPRKGRLNARAPRKSPRPWWPDAEVSPWPRSASNSPGSDLHHRAAASSGHPPRSRRCSTRRMQLVCSNRPRQKHLPRQSTEEEATGCRRAGCAGLPS